MSAVWKFDLVRDGYQIVEAPRGARPLHVAFQGGVPCLWALVDPHAPLAGMSVAVVGTGWDGAWDAADYVGTIHETEPLMGALFVWHVFAQVGS